MRILMLAEARCVHTQRWAMGLFRRGFEVHILSRSMTAIPDVSVIPLEIPNFGARHLYRWEKRYERFLHDVIQQVCPDVVHVHFLRDWPVASHSQRCGIPLVISTWGSDVIADEHCELDTADTREVKVGLLRSADAVTATTLFLADETARYGRIDRSKIRVIPFGVEVKRFDQLSALAGCTIGFVKHLESKYGLEVLLKAMPAIRKRVPNVRLVVVGDGARRDRLHHLARQNGLEDCIDWRGAIPHEDVPRVLSGFDVLAMPSMSRSETFGVSAIEAQAAGVPVVASDWPGVREAVLHDCGGLLVPAGDVGSLTDALVRVLTDEGLRQRMGRDGRSFVLERFDFERNIDAMVQVYEEVAATCPADIY